MYVIWPFLLVFSFHSTFILFLCSVSCRHTQLQQWPLLFLWEMVPWIFPIPGPANLLKQQMEMYASFCFNLAYFSLFHFIRHHIMFIRDFTSVYNLFMNYVGNYWFSCIIWHTFTEEIVQRKSKWSCTCLTILTM